MIKFLCAVLGTIFLEFWKRTENSWAFLWDVTDYEINEPDRPEFYGTTTEYVSKIAYSFNSCTKNCIKSLWNRSLSVFILRCLSTPPGPCGWLWDPEVPNEIPVLEVLHLGSDPLIYGAGGDSQCTGGHNLPRASHRGLLLCDQPWALFADHHHRPLPPQCTLHLHTWKGAFNLSL